MGTASGGGAGITADLAARHGMPFARLSPTTVERLQGVLPEGAYVGNPLDINTANAADVYAALADSPEVRFLIEPWSLPWPTDDDEYHWQRRTMGRLADIATSTGLPRYRPVAPSSHPSANTSVLSAVPSSLSRVNITRAPTGVVRFQEPCWAEKMPLR